MRRFILGVCFAIVVAAGAGCGINGPTWINTSEINMIAGALGTLNAYEQIWASSILVFTRLGDDVTVNGITGGWHQSNESSFLGLTAGTIWTIGPSAYPGM